MYKSCVEYGLSPSEFWAMSPDELGEWFNVMRPKRNYGRMTESQARSISDRIAANPEKYI